MGTSVVVTVGEFEFTTEDVVQASVVEEFSPLAITLPVSTCELLLYTQEADFSILNPFRTFVNFRRKQPISVFEVINDTRHFIGLYFLDEWENTSKTLVRLSCVDQVGLLDMLSYNGGVWLTPTTVGTLIGQFQNSTGIQFEVDPDLAVEEITGWLPISTYREALQQICFATGAYVLTSRHNFVKVSRLASEFGVVTRGINTGVAGAGQSRVWQKRWRPSQWELTREAQVIYEEDIVVGSPIVQRPFVSGVEVVAHNYSLGSEEKELFKDTLTIGTHKVTFSEPMHTLSVIGGTIDESGANYAVISVTVEGVITLTGETYIDSKAVFSEYMSGLAEEKESILAIDKATLVNNGNAADVTDRIYDYYQLRLEKKARLVAPTMAVGDEIRIYTDYEQEIRGYVERMTVNLSGGFIADTVIYGEVDVPIYELYAGVFTTGQSRNWQRRFRIGVTSN